MKKNLLLTVAIMFAVSATGQPVNQKAHISGYKEQRSSENFLNLLSKGVKLDRTEYRTWDDISGTFITNYKTTFVYGTGTMVSTDYFFYAPALPPDQWHATSKTDYTYDANGNPTYELTSTSDISLDVPVWGNSSKTESTYDINSNITLYILSTWNTLLSQWVGVMRIETTYDAYGHPTLEINYSWDNPGVQWVESAKTESSYDGNGNIATETTYVWDATIPIPGFVNSSKTDYTFNGLGQKVLYITSDWDKTIAIPDWVNSSQTELGYDGAGNQNVMTDYTWDQTLAIPDWVAEFKIESTFDINNRPTTVISSLWDTGTDAFVPFNKTESTYGNVFSPTVTYDETNGFQYDINSTTWLPSSQTDDYYSDAATYVNKFSERNIRVYPNPAREFIVFDNVNILESASISVYDLQGRKVMEKQLSGNEQISVTNLSKGLYVYKLNNGGISYSGRLVKK
jgi:hypothetical protein